MNTIVTGGAGYIGGHVARALARAGHRVLVIDDLSNGHEDAVASDAEFVRADVTLPGVLAGAARKFGARAVLHFAARIQVGESVAKPALYYASNVGGMLRVIE